MTNVELKRIAQEDFDECRKYGHYPDWTNEPLTDELIKKWSVEYDMTEDEFKKYADYFFELCN